MNATSCYEITQQLRFLEIHTSIFFLIFLIFFRCVLRCIFWSPHSTLWRCCANQDLLWIPFVWLRISRISAHFSTSKIGHFGHVFTSWSLLGILRYSEVTILWMEKTHELTRLETSMGRPMDWSKSMPFRETKQFFDEGITIGGLNLEVKKKNGV